MTSTTELPGFATWKLFFTEATTPRLSLTVPTCSAQFCAIAAKIVLQKLYLNNFDNFRIDFHSNHGQNCVSSRCPRGSHSGRQEKQVEIFCPH
jgi:hypothetical protein